MSTLRRPTPTVARRSDDPYEPERVAVQSGWACVRDGWLAWSRLLPWRQVTVHRQGAGGAFLEQPVGNRAHRFPTHHGQLS